MKRKWHSFKWEEDKRGKKEMKWKWKEESKAKHSNPFEQQERELMIAYYTILLIQPNEQVKRNENA